MRALGSMLIVLVNTIGDKMGEVYSIVIDIKDAEGNRRSDVFLKRSSKSLDEFSTAIIGATKELLEKE